MSPESLVLEQLDKNYNFQFFISVLQVDEFVEAPESCSEGLEKLKVVCNPFFFFPNENMFYVFCCVSFFPPFTDIDAYSFLLGTPFSTSKKKSQRDGLKSSWRAKK